MFDRVTIHVSDLEAGRRFYETLLGRDWGNFEIAPASEPTRNLHVAFIAASRDEVDAFWRRGVDAGYESDGEPGLRPQYDTDYYGAFLLDPDGNSVESVYHGRVRAGDGIVDHLWIGVRDVAASHRFWETIATPLGPRFTSELAERFHLAARGRSFASSPTAVHRARTSTSRSRSQPTSPASPSSIPTGTRSSAQPPGMTRGPSPGPSRSPSLRS